MKILVFALSLVTLVACSKIKTTPKNSKFNQDAAKYKNTLIINEYCVKGDHVNELVENSDWFEIYNPTEEEIVIEKWKWSVTDDLHEPDKFFLPEMTIKPKSYVVVWCDGEDTNGEEIHASFKLNASGEDIGLFYKDELIDAVTYGELLTENVSYGRVADGSDEWVTFQRASIGRANSTSIQL